MIFLDANVFLRYLVQSNAPADQEKAEAAAKLFREAMTGATTLTTSDAIIAEVVFVLASPRQYGLPAPEITARLKPLLNLRGVKLPGKRRVLRALDLYASSPKLGFVDALAIAYVERSGLTLASFDRHFDGVPNIKRWEP
jgi:predicted nucleic acid-binding protein